MLGCICITPTTPGAVGAMEQQPPTNPMGRCNSTMGQHDAGCCVAGSVFPAENSLQHHLGCSQKGKFLMHMQPAPNTHSTPTPHAACTQHTHSTLCPIKQHAPGAPHAHCQLHMYHVPFSFMSPVAQLFPSVCLPLTILVNSNSDSLQKFLETEFFDFSHTTSVTKSTHLDNSNHVKQKEFELDLESFVKVKKKSTEKF